MAVMSMQDEINAAMTDKAIIIEALKMSLDIPWRTRDHKQRIRRMIAELNSGGLLVGADGSGRALPKDKS